jgi:hypothetical protein
MTIIVTIMNIFDLQLLYLFVRVISLRLAVVAVSYTVVIYVMISKYLLDVMLKDVVLEDVVLKDVVFYIDPMRANRLVQRIVDYQCEFS